MPKWGEMLVDAISSAIEFKGIALLEARYATPDESVWGVDLIEVAPAVVAESGGEVYGVVHSFDLVAAQRALSEVTALVLGTEEDGRTSVTVEGRVGGHDVVVIVYTCPFHDAESAGSLSDID